MNHTPLESPELPILEPPSTEAVFLPAPVTEERVWQIAAMATVAVHLGGLATAFLMTLLAWLFLVPLSPGASVETNLVGKTAHFDSLGQPDGIIVAVWVDPIGVLQVGLRLSTGQNVVFPFLSIVLVP